MRLKVRYKGKLDFYTFHCHKIWNQNMDYYCPFLITKYDFISMFWLPR